MIARKRAERRLARETHIAVHRPRRARQLTPAPTGCYSWRRKLILILIIATERSSMNPARWLLAALLALPAAAGAEAPPAPEHGKAATADASPVDPGVLEAELGYAPAWNNRGGGAGFDVAERGSVHDLSGTLTYGVVSDVDLKLSTGFAAVHDSASLPRRGNGATDLAVGARWRLLNLADRAFELAVLADAVLPTGTRGSAKRLALSQEFWSARGALAATKDFGAVTTNAELALEAPVSGDAGGLRSIAQVNGAIGWQVMPWLQPELELNYQHDAALGPDAQVLAITAGVVAPFGEGHRVVAAVQQGVWGRNTTQTTAAVLSFKTAL
jgi:hypothetical protein